MAISSPVFKPIIGTGAVSEKLTNLSLPTINTEVPHALQSDLRALLVRSRTLADIKFAFTVAESGTNYVTIKSGAVLFLNDIQFTSKTIYFQSDTVTTLEVLELYT